MTDQDLLDRINWIEQNYPVQNIYWGDLRVWPLIRMLIGYEALRGQYYHISKTNSRFSHPLLNYLYSNFWLKGRDFFKLLKKNILKFPLEIRQYITFKRHKKQYIASISSVSSKNERVDGKYFSRFTDSLHFFLSEEGFVVKEDTLLFSDVEQVNSVYNPKIPLEFYENIAMLLTIFQRKRKDNIGDLFEWLEAHNQKTAITVSSVRGLCEKINILRIKYLLFFKVYRPKAVFIGCFYSENSYGATLAGHQAGIPSFEIQHGQQGDSHFMYGNWSNMPQDGYKLIPKYFAMWGEQSVKRITNWANATSYHKAFLAGNPWVAYVKQYEGLLSKTNTLAFFRQLKEKKQRIVMISLQPISLQELFPAHLIELMDDHSLNVFWCIRLHPLMNKNQVELKKYINYDSNRMNIEECTEVSLYDLMKYADVNITYWSTVAYEALLYQVPSIILHPNGHSKMKEYIDKGLFRMAENKENLRTQIFADLPEKFSNDYIKADTASIKSIIPYLR